MQVMSQLKPSQPRSVQTDIRVKTFITDEPIIEECMFCEANGHTIFRCEKF